jgi:FkbM family methyltransferase
MIKRTFRNLLNSLGYSVHKIPKPDPDGFALVQVGDFEIRINNKSGLKYCYEHCKDYGAQLLRLTSFLNSRYPDLEVIDIGANQGDSVALIKSGADVPVISVEGDETIIDQFKHNTAQFNNVTLLKTFLSDSETELACSYTKIGHNLTIDPAQNGAGTALTKFLSVNSLYAGSVINDRCKLLKIDTEGFDLKIIRGADIFLNAVTPVILFEFNRDNLQVTETAPFEIFSWLLEHAYDQILIYESDGRFMFSSNLKDQRFLRQLFDYFDGNQAKIYYIDLVVFHSRDELLANDFIMAEEKHRVN